MKNKTQVLITFDVDPCKDIDLAMERAIQILKDTNIRATFYYTANIAKKKAIRELTKLNHEIGCHALNHDDYEEFDKLSKNEAMNILKEATSLLEEKTKKKITSFRSARVKISSNTLNVLQELGYKTDSSVCSQRLDLISSNLINLGWLIAPRLPYFPNLKSPFKKGGMKILEIPVSAFILPLISTTLRIFGLTFMKVLFQILYFESMITGKPIVYLIHPHEFIYKKGELKFSWKFFVPDKTWLIRGFPIRLWLGRRLDGNEVYEINRKFFKWISKKNVEFKTVEEFRKWFEVKKCLLNQKR